MKKVLLAAAAVIGLAAAPAMAQTSNTMEKGVDQSKDAVTSPANPSAAPMHKNTKSHKARDAKSRDSSSMNRSQAQAPRDRTHDRMGNTGTAPNALEKGSKLNNSQ